MHSVLLFLHNSSNNIALQQRAKHVNNGSKLDASVCGKKQIGETDLQAIIRETKEELDLAIHRPVCIGTYIRPVKPERTYTVFYAYVPKPKLTLNPEEVAHIHWLTVESLQRDLHTLPLKTSTREIITYVMPYLTLATRHP